MVGRLSICVKARMYQCTARCIKRELHPIAETTERTSFLIYSIDPLLDKRAGPAIGHRLA